MERGARRAGGARCPVAEGDRRGGGTAGGQVVADGEGEEAGIGFWARAGVCASVAAGKRSDSEA